MRAEAAVKFVHELQRYRDSRCNHRHRRGFYIRNALIKWCTPAQSKQAHRTMDVSTYRYAKAVWVELDKLRAHQGCLGRRSLVYQLNHFPCKKLPTVVRIDGGLHLLWDGNHRATASILLGKRRIRCLEFQQLTKKR